MKTISICVTGLLALTLLLGYKACSQSIHLAERFRAGKITLTFRSSLQKAVSTQGDVLELATLESDEQFRASNERYLLGDIYMGTTAAEINARCTFRYHLRLSEHWQLDVRSNICHVRAPAFKPTLPVAIQTDRMYKNASSGWARFDKHEQLASLEAAMTPELARRAANESHMEAVREACRQSVGQFVKNWLLREDHWRRDRFTAIIVQFPDERALPATGLGDAIPVIRLSD